MLCWSLIFDPFQEELVVVPIQSQAFGSLGAVVASFQIVKLIQVIMENLFQLVILCYVDDFFWATPKFPKSGAPDTDWVTELLGWQLGPEKSFTGVGITLLGLEVSMQSNASCWQLSRDKSQHWVEDMTKYLSEDRLTPSEASKLTGRVAFLNTQVFSAAWVGPSLGPLYGASWTSQGLRG